MDGMDKMLGDLFSFTLKALRWLFQAIKWMDQFDPKPSPYERLLAEQKRAAAMDPNGPKRSSVKHIAKVVRSSIRRGP